MGGQSHTADRLKVCADRVMKCEPLWGVVGCHGDQDVWEVVEEASELACLVLDEIVPNLTSVWATMESAPKTSNEVLVALPFLGWCPDPEADGGGDIRVCWWEPRLKGGSWWSDRDLPESPVLWTCLPSAPAKATGESAA